MPSFVHKNALAWYMFVNKSSDPLCPNGTLYVVTGCDKTATYALATSSTTSLYYTAGLPTIRYQDGEWQGDEDCRVAAMTSDATAHADPCAVIIRGMQVALSAADWTNYIFRNEPPQRLSFYYLLNVPVTGRQARWRTMMEIRSSSLDMEKYRSNGDSRWVTFTPSMVVLQYLLRQSPRAHVAIAEDRTWCSLTDNSDGTVQEVSRIVRKLLEEHEISEENGLVTLVPLRSNVQPSAPRSRNPLRRGFISLREGLEIKIRRWIIARNLAKVFPAEGLPRGML